MEKKHHLVTRRSFLQWSGMVAGAGLAAPFISQPGDASASPGNAVQPLKMGVLLPDLGVEGSLASRFLEGIQAGADAFCARRQIEFFTHAAGTTPAGAYEVARTLLGGGIKLVLWLSDSPISSNLRRLFEEHQSVLLMSGAGANLPRLEDSSTAIFHHSLGYWQSAWGLGKQAVSQLGKRAWILSSLYDSGYDTPYTFQQGFEAAGGQVLGWSVTHKKPGDLKEALARLRDQKVDLAAGFYCGSQGADFLNGWAESGLRHPLVGGGGLRAKGETPVFAWRNRMKGQQADAFRAACIRRGVVDPEEFHLLGFEAIGLIEMAQRTVDERRAGSLQEGLENAQLESPRGLLRINKPSHMVTGPLYQGADAAQAIAQPGFDEPLVQMLRASLKTGWSHAYFYSSEVANG